MAEKAQTLRKESTKGKYNRGFSKQPPHKQKQVHNLSPFICMLWIAPAFLYWKGIAVVIAPILFIYLNIFKPQ